MHGRPGPSTTHDLRSFLDAHAERHLHVRRDVPLDAVGALTAQANEPIVFHAIEEFPGFELVDQLFVNRAAQARVLECDADRVVPTLLEVLREGAKPLVEIDDAPCHERVLAGDDVDLGVLPIVTHTPRDPYPYTTCFAVHRDPETAEWNSMFPRCGVLGRNEMVASFVTSTANRILAKHKQAETKMPQAIAIGTHPAWELAACYSAPHPGWWELELFEAITGRVGELVRCRTVDLHVPADASIVIEGYVDPERRAPDGPSPGPTMLFTPEVSQQPVFEVTAVTMCREPIYRNHQMTPFTDHQEMPRLFHEAILYDRLVSMGLRVHDVHFPQGGGSLSVVIQVEAGAEGVIPDALLTVLGSPWLNTKLVIAVDPDIDVYDHRDLHYALATRVDPSKDVIVLPSGRGSPFDPSARPIVEASPEAAATRFPSIVGKIAIDATKPVPYRSVERKAYERAWPIAWGEYALEDFLAERPVHGVVSEALR